MVLFWIIVFLLLVYFITGIRVINQYHRGVILTLGRYSHTKEPGLRFIWPIFQTMILVDIRVRTADVSHQETITKDNVPVRVDAVVYFEVEDPKKAVLKVSDYRFAVTNYAQAALRDTIGQVELDTLLSERERIAEEIKTVVDEATTEWGINVTAVKIQDIQLPKEMRRVMAQQAEAERARRSVIIRAEGEKLAAENLAEAGRILSQTQGGLTLRTLETIEKINPDPSKTVIFLLPIELQGFFQKFFKKEE